jgi:protocatechuate 3,4-dioxygenase beta subunit
MRAISGPHAIGLALWLAVLMVPPPARIPAPRAPAGEKVRGSTVVLHPASWLFGRVVDSSGAPVDATELEIVPLERSEVRVQGGPDRDLRFGYPDAAGRFLLTTLPEERVEVTARAPGLIAEPVRLRSPSAGGTSGEILLVLRPAAAASGEVRAEDGRPIEGATVAVVAWGDDSALLRRLANREVPQSGLPAVETGDTGTFVLRDLPAGRYSLVVTAAGYEPVAVSGLEMPAGAEPVALGTVYLAPAAKLSGRVVDADGEPVAGAEISVSLLDAGGAAAVGRAGEPVRSDESGSFTVGDLARSSRVRLAVRRQGYLPAQSPPLDVPSDDEATIELRRAAAVSGRVTDADRRPVEGAKVRIRPRAERGSLLRQSRILSGEATGVTTDAKGSFRMNEVEPGPGVLTVTAACCRPVEKAVEIERGDEPAVLDLVLPRGDSLSGTVLTAAGRPVAGASVAGGGHSARSDETGAFRLDGLEPGPLVLTATHPELGRTRGRAEVGGPHQAEIRFAEPGTIRGRVSDSGGNGIAAAWVHIECANDLVGRPVRADAAGHFERVAQPGSCTLDVEAEGYLPADPRQVVLPAGETVSVGVTLGDGSTVRGRVVGAEAFELARTRLVARSAGRAPVEGRIDPAGDFEISGLQSGRWRIAAASPAGRRGEAEVDVEAGEEARVDLELGGGRTLEGTVRLDGAPLQGAWITVGTLGGIRLAHTLAGVRGDFTVPGLTAGADGDGGRVQLHVSTPEGDIRWSRSVDLDRSTPAEVEVWTGSLGGRVVEAGTATGVARAVLELVPLGDSSWLATASPPSGPDGGFGPWRLPEGHYRLSVSAPGFAPAATDLSVERGAELVVTVPLVR